MHLVSLKFQSQYIFLILRSEMNLATKFSFLTKENNPPNASRKHFSQHILNSQI